MDESEFQREVRDTDWYREYVQRYGEDPNFNDPNYDYRRAWDAGAAPTVRDPTDNQLHWDSRFKGQNHPNRFINGVDTITGQPQASRGVMDSFIDDMMAQQMQAPPQLVEQASMRYVPKGEPYNIGVEYFYRAPGGGFSAGPRMSAPPTDFPGQRAYANDSYYRLPTPTQRLDPETRSPFRNFLRGLFED